MKRARSPKVFRGAKPAVKDQGTVLTSTPIRLMDSQVYIFYTTLTGTSQRVAAALHDKLANLEGIAHEPKLLSLDDDVDDLEEYFLKTPKNSTQNIYLLVLPSYETDSPIDYFIEHLTDTFQDFRVDKYQLLDQFHPPRHRCHLLHRCRRYRKVRHRLKAKQSH